MSRRIASKRAGANPRRTAPAGTGTMTKIITVGLGARAYAIHVGNGLMAEAGALLKPFAHGKVPVVTDAQVGEIHLARLLDVLGKAGLDGRPIVMPPGEASKSFAGLETLCRQLL